MRRSERKSKMRDELTRSEPSEKGFGRKGWKEAEVLVGCMYVGSVDRGLLCYMGKGARRLSRWF